MTEEVLPAVQEVDWNLSRLERAIATLQPVGEWRYTFSGKGGVVVEGLTAAGIRDGVRELARQGEVIRTLEVRLELDREEEAYFLARAARYSVRPDGTEVLLDTTVRGKRIAKYSTGRDGRRYFDEAWFEQGVTKAARNAEMALMPLALKQWMLQQAEQADKAPPPARAARRALPEGPEKGSARAVLKEKWQSLSPDAVRDVAAFVRFCAPQAIVENRVRLPLLTDEQVELVKAVVECRVEEIEHEHYGVEIEGRQRCAQCARPLA